MLRRTIALCVTMLLAMPALAQDEPPPDPPQAPPAEAPAAPPPPAWHAPPKTAPKAGLKRYAKKRSIEISGGTALGFETEKVGGTRSSLFYFDLAPRFLYFVVDGLSVGGAFLFSYYWAKAGDSGSIVNFGLLPVLEYNFDVGGRVFPYAGLTLGYTMGHSSGGGTSATSNQFNTIFEGGIKIVFGRALLGFGMELPIIVNMVEGGDPYVTTGVRIMTRYGIWF